MNAAVAVQIEVAFRAAIGHHRHMTSDPIVPDDKDWTWVLHSKCDECAFDVYDLPAVAVAPIIRDNGTMWAQVLTRPADELRARPKPDQWSPLEYGAHVRDVYRIYLVRLQLMLNEDDPLYANWDQDESAVLERYNEQDPATVSADLVTSSIELADAFDALTVEQWARPGRRSDGANFTVDSFARYLVHDPVHHLWDVGVLS